MDKPADASAPLVVVHGVSKTFHVGNTATVALREVDLTVHSGELLMLVGPSGCGKTTLISVISGILDADYGSGSVTVFGENITAQTPAQRTAFRGKNIGFVFQSFNLIPALTAAENVSIPAILNGLPRRAALKLAGDLLDQVGLGDRRDHHPTQLSGGQQQRVAIARALVHDPRLIVCDEPTSALDHATGESVMQLLRKVAIRPGRALIVVTHDSRIFSYAERIAQMNDGRITSITAPPAALAHVSTGNH